MIDSPFQIHEGPPPPGYTSVLEEPIYYSTEYLTIQAYPKVRSSLLLDIEKKLVVGKAIFVVKESGTAVSLPSAPFGSLCCAPGLDSSTLKWWAEDIIEKGMVIRHPAEFYPGYNSSFCEIAAHEYREELNHHIDLNEYHLGKLHNMQIRRIRKCRNAGFELEEIKNENELPDLYEFIERCREEQGLVINISLEKFMQSFVLLPDRYRAFRIVSADGETVAATVVIMVCNKIAYNYLPASTKAFHQYSPMAFLLFRVALQYQQEGFEILDLGITSIEGEEQTSLAKFKQRMGAIRTSKLTYQF